MVVDQLDYSINRTNVLISSDYPLYRSALSSALKTRLNNYTFIESDSYLNTIKILKSDLLVEMLLLDLNDYKQEIDYSELRFIRKVYPNLKTVVMSRTNEAETMTTCKQMGACSFFTKRSSTAHILDSIAEALDNVTWIGAKVVNELKIGKHIDVNFGRMLQSFTLQQKRVLDGLVSGSSNKEIGILLGIRESTIKAHVSGILRKMKVKTRSQVVSLAIAFNRSK